MKKFHINLLSFLLLSVVLFTACEKDEKVNALKEVIQTNEYVFNTATKKLSPETDVNVAIESTTGVESIYSYLIRNNKADSLLIVYMPSKNENVNASNFNLLIPTASFAKANLTEVTGIKLMIKRKDNSANEEFIKISAYTPAIPKLSNFAQKLVAEDNKVTLVGVANSENGLQKIEIQDDSEVAFKTIHTIDVFTSNTYNLSYEYTLRANVKQLRVVLTDDEGYTTQMVVNVEATATIGPYKKYENVVMNSQGITIANGFIGQTGTFLSACDLPIKGVDADVFLYTTGLTGTPSLTLYAAGGAANIINGFKCNDVGWTLATGETLKQSKLRVLDPTNTVQKKVYEAVAGNSITDLKTTGLLSGIAASSNTAKYVDNFDATTKNLILIQTAGSKNILIKVKSVSFLAATAANSSITMDIYVEN